MERPFDDAAMLHFIRESLFRTDSSLHHEFSILLEKFIAERITSRESEWFPCLSHDLHSCSQKLADTPLRAHFDQVPLNYLSETVVQPSSTAHFHYGFPTVEPLSWYSNKLLSSNLKTAIFQPCKRCHTP